MKPDLNIFIKQNKEIIMEDSGTGIYYLLNEMKNTTGFISMAISLIKIEEYILWYIRLAHLNYRDLISIVTRIKRILEKLGGQIFYRPYREGKSYR